MKRTIGIILSIILILSAILVFSAYSGGYISKASERLDEHASVIEKSIYEKNWDSAAAEYDLINTEWEKTGKTWAILIDHFEIDNIETTLSRISKFIESRDTSMALAESALLRQYIKHIPEKEKFNFKNIF